MGLFRNRREKREVEKGLINTGESVEDFATKRPVGGAIHGYEAAKDFDKAKKARKQKPNSRTSKPSSKSTKRRKK